MIPIVRRDECHEQAGTTGASGATTRARVRLTRLRLVVALTAVLGLAQILYEDVVLFVATTRDGVSGPLASPLVAIGIPLTIAALLLLVLVGGALWFPDDTDGRGSAHRSEPAEDESSAASTGVPTPDEPDAADDRCADEPDGDRQ